MFVVKTTLGQSNIHGIGVFAAEFIPKGSTVWEFHDGLDLVIPDADLDGLPPATRREVRHYGYLDDKLKAWVLCAGTAAFVNHSDEPTLTWDPVDGIYGPNYAARDIHPGEELTDDYSGWDADFENKLGRVAQ